MRFHPLVRGIAESITDLLFPPACLGCGAVTPASRGLLCSACRSSLHHLLRSEELYRETCHRLTQGGAVAGLVSRFVFEKGGPLQMLLHELKYGGMTRIGLELGREVGANVTTWCAEMPLTVIVPVPLHFTRKRERGYNQCEYIARGIREVTHLPILMPALIRQRPTRSQTTLDRHERAANVQGAFQLRAAELRHLRAQSVLLVDDVITTGSTVRECARVLVNAGVRSVVACSVALAAADI